MTLDVFTLGETMLRLVPPGQQRLEQASTLEMTFGGAESNVAVDLARLGKQVAWHSRLPDNPLGRQVTAMLMRHGVDVDSVVWTKDERLGVYYVEYGPPPRGIQVWYDRANSAASHMQPADLPLNTIADARWLHITGITPALSDSAAATVQAAVSHAVQHKVTISFDVNYRAKLWTPQAAARVLTPLCEHADMVIVAANDARLLWNIDGDEQHIARALHDRWGKTLMVTHPQGGATGFDGDELSQVAAIPVVMVDRLGAGDAFAAGVICRLLEGASLAEALPFGAAMSSLKLTMPGDLAILSRAEIDSLLDNQRRDVHR